MIFVSRPQIFSNHFYKVGLYLWAALALMQVPVSHAENSHIRLINVSHYDDYNGLSGNKVTQIGQDETGYMWFGTLSGLSRFNSQDFTYFQQDSIVANSLPGNSVSSFILVNDEIWISINELGLARYQQQPQQFKLFPIQQPNSRQADDGIFHKVVFGLAADKANNVWVFQFDAGFSIYHQDTQKFSHHTPDNTQWLESTRFFNAKTAADGHIWAVTLEGVVYDIDPKTLEAAVYHVDFETDDPKKSRIYCLSHSPTGEIYISSYNGVYQLNLQSNRFEPLVTRQHMQQLFGEELTIRSLTADSQGNLWLATLKGLVLYRQGQLTQINFIDHGEPIKETLNVRSIFEDSEGNIWVATDKNGVYRLNHQWDDASIQLPFGSKSEVSISEAFIKPGNFEDSIWLYDQQQHKLLLNRYQQGQLTTLKTYDATQQLPQPILLMYVDQNYQMWVAAVDGLYRYDRNADIFELVESTILEAGIKLMFEMDNQLFITVYGDKQLYQWDKNQQKVIKVAQHNLLNDVISSHAVGPSGLIWLVGNNGLEVIDPETQKVIHQIKSDENYISLAVKNDEVWLLANGTIIRFKIQDGELITQDTSVLNQLVSKYSVSGLAIIDNQLWLPSLQGLMVIDIDNQKIIKRFTTADNLPSNKVTKIFQMHDDSVMVITSAGLVHINSLTEVDEKITTKSLTLQQLYHNDEAIESIAELPFNYGSLRIQYQLLSYSQPKSHRYQYRLHSGNDWINAGNQTQQSFYQLPAGQYQLQIRGKTMNKDWSEPLNLDFSVLSAPWNSQKAYLIYGLIGLLILTVIFYLLRKRWQYNASLSQAKEKRLFAENQLSLTSSLVKAIDVNELLEKIKIQIGEQIQADKIEVCYWNCQTNYQLFSDQSLTTAEQNQLGKNALEMFHANEKYRQQEQQNGAQLLVLFSHSEERLGLITFFRQQKTFKENEVSLAIAYAAQSSLAIENARLFEAVNHLADRAKTSSQAKSDFLAQVSHEIRTPMNGILGMNQLLLDSTLNEDQIIYAEAVAESGEHLLAIINDILDLSKIEAGKLVLEHRQFDLIQMIDEITQSFISVSRKKRLDFVVCLDAELMTACIGDVTRIKQIIINLLSNAFKFTQKGAVHLSLMPGHQADEILIVVKDTGMGIEQGVIDNLFDPFAQADSSITRKYGGTGLGLSIVKQLSEKMNGEINIESQPGLGTEVNCLLNVELQHSAPQHTSLKGTTACFMAAETTPSLALRQSLLRLGLTISYDIESAFDCLFVVEAEKAEFDHEIAIANRELKPVYLIKSQLRNHPSHNGTYKVINWPFLHKTIAQLFLTTSAPQNTHQPKHQPKRSMHLLVLEDNPINQQLLMELLEKEGHMVDIFDDPYHALTAIENHRYDLLLVDYHLPGMTGVDFILNCRELGNTDKVVMMSADISNQLQQECHHHGIDKLITKPFKIQALMSLLQSS